MSAVNRVLASQSVTVLKRRMQRGALDPVNIALLRTMDVFWDDPHGRLYAEGLTALDLFVAREGHARVPHNHREGVMALGPWVSNRRTDKRKGSLRPAKIAELEQRAGWTWDPSEDEFQAGLALLDRFISSEGHALVPGLHVEEGAALGTWVCKRRIDRKLGRLNAERTAQLEQRAGWSWDPIADEYRTAVGLLAQFAAREGHTRVPGRHIEDGYGLGSWVVKRRRDRKRGSVSLADAAELEQMTGWTWDPIADEYRTALRLLDQYIDREGHARVHRTHLEDGFALGKWVANRRNNRTRANADPVQTAEISSRPGWTWDPLDDDFRDGLRALDLFVVEHGHARVPQRHLEDGFALGRWVTGRRVDRRLGRLTAERTAELGGRTGWSWDPSDDDFNRGLNALDAYITAHGHARIPRMYTDGGDINLGKWVDNRRGERRGGRLATERCAALDARAGWAWERGERA